MDLEKNIKDTISKKLEDGTVERLIGEQLEKGVVNALENLFRSYGDITKIIENQIKSVMIPYLESYDYSKYITKLDAVLVDVLKNSALENKQLLENFKELMVPQQNKTIKVTELFERWMDYVAENVNTDGLEICFEDKPTYQNVDVRFEVDYNNERSWSNIERAVVVFECDHDKELNVEINIHRWKKTDKDEWIIDYDSIHDLNSLRQLDKFEVLLMKLRQNHTKLILDSGFETGEVEVEEVPEPIFR